MERSSERAENGGHRRRKWEIERVNIGYKRGWLKEDSQDEVPD